MDGKMGGWEDRRIDPGMNPFSAAVWGRLAGKQSEKKKRGADGWCQPRAVQQRPEHDWTVRKVSVW